MPRVSIFDLDSRLYMTSSESTILTSPLLAHGLLGPRCFIPDQWAVLAPDTNLLTVTANYLRMNFINKM